jgi:hypothetical protein
MLNTWSVSFGKNTLKGSSLMAKAKTYQYRIQYVDNTYQLVDWTKAQFEYVGKAMATDESAVIVGDDIFRVSDIRAIVFLPPVPEPTPEEKKAEAEQQLSEWGFVDPEVAEWLKNNGINIGGVN